MEKTWITESDMLITKKKEIFIWKNRKYVVFRQKRKTISSEDIVDKIVNRVIHNVWITLWKKVFLEKYAGKSWKKSIF